MIARPSIRLMTLAVLLMCPAVACRHPGDTRQSTPASPGAATEFTDTRWHLTHLNGEPVRTHDGARQPFLRFVSADSRMEGFASCNQFSGPYVISGSGVRLTGPTISTRMACADPSLNVQEREFLQALEALDRYEVAGSELRLYAGAREVARLQRAWE